MFTINHKNSKIIRHALFLFLALSPFIIAKQTSVDKYPILEIRITSNLHDVFALRRWVEEDLTKVILTQVGVAGTRVLGGKTKLILDIKKSRVGSLGISLAQVKKSIDKHFVIRGSRLYTQNPINPKLLAPASISDLNNFVIGITSKGIAIKFADVGSAKIMAVTTKTSSLKKFYGISIRIFKTKDAQSKEVVSAVKKAVVDRQYLKGFSKQTRIEFLLIR